MSTKFNRSFFVVSIIILIGGCVNKEEIINFKFSKLNQKRMLDPVHLEYISEYVYLDNFATRLISVDHNNNFVPRLAKDLKVSTDRQTYTFNLGLDYFSDGQAITCHDVKQSIKRTIIYGAAHSTPKNYILGAEKLKNFDQEIEGINCSDNNITIKLNQKIKDFLYYLNMTDFSILHPEVVEKEKIYLSDWEKYSSGAYKPQYKDDRLFFIANTHSKMITNLSPRKIEITSDNDEKLDFGTLNYSEITKTDFSKEMKKYEVLLDKTSLVIYFILNTESVNFNGLKERKAFRQIFKNGVKFASQSMVSKTDQYFPPRSVGYLEQLVFKSDPKKEVLSAKSLTILSVKGMEDYTPENFKEDTARIFANEGVTVKFDFDNTWDEFLLKKKNNEYDVIYMGMSMNYRHLTEGINLQLNEQTGSLKDQENKIRSQVNRYNNSLDKEADKKIIKDIAMAIHNTAELIPIGYLPMAKYFNSEKLDTTEVNFEESFQIWKLKTKKD
jgi:MarR-like DNA-binding transcriptional regulator SgrR of sgrS sRNA